MKASYLDTIALIERLHRQCLEVVKGELERLGLRDINSVQAMILFNIGETEVTVGELTQRGYYLGSNVSYNVKKMVENGYLEQERSPHDRRAILVRATEQGLEIYRRLHALYDEHANELAEGAIDQKSLEQTKATLTRLETFWSAARMHGGRAAPLRVTTAA